ncbi:hypothetical protein HHI36_010367 [Cryptolaemus montrouzieri]|uniref:C3H1-type domain-containing protein n=1 Tax=Cryptolaemus montrouzieri TaxID=559131 RepID=A0ABD2MIJ7_9CUCU
MTDLDSPRRNNDCYFYYYSTCAKGDSCTFRHEPSALGCETMCSFWKEGKCLNVHCNFRHMELRKNRKAIQCYWETQPGGCLKPHCPFLHQNVKQSLNEFTGNNIGPNCGSNTDTSQIGKQSEVNQAPDKNFKNPVDSLVVNFEEESDNESAPSFSPIKPQVKKLKVKTLEEIRLEKVQEESAAYFSYHDVNHPITEAEDDLRQRILVKMRQKRLQQDQSKELSNKRRKINFIENETLDEHIRATTDPKITQNTAEDISLDEHIFHRRKQKFGSSVKKEDKELKTIKIKTLAEIRAERKKKQEQAEPDSQYNQTFLKRKICFAEEHEVTSTSKDEMLNETTKIEQPKKRLKLKKLPPTESKIVSSNIIDNVSSKEKLRGEEIENSESIVEKEDVVIEVTKSDLVVINEGGENNIEEKSETTKISYPLEPHSKQNEEKPILSTRNVDEESKADSIPSELYKDTETNMLQAKNNSETNSIESDSCPNKLAEEVLLLEDDEDYTNVTLKAEDELLEEIDDILGS